MSDPYVLTYNHLVTFISNKTKGMRHEPHVVADVMLNYVMGTSLRQCAREFGLSEETVKGWKQKDWFSEVEAMARKVSQNKADRKLSSVFDQALNKLAIRLEKGDPHVMRDGTIVFKPVTANNCALIAAIAYDKRALIRGEPTTIEAEGNVEDQLESLAQQFREITTKSDIKVIK